LSDGKVFTYNTSLSSVQVMHSFQGRTLSRLSIRRWVCRNAHVYLGGVALLLSLAVNASPKRQPVQGGWFQKEIERPLERPITLAILDFGDSTLGRVASDTLAANLKQEAGLSILDRDQVRAAARGTGYAGSINLSLNEARDLGAALGCDFFILGDAQTLRRSPSTGPVYFESYSSLFIVSARSGRLIRWDRPNFRAATAAAAEQALLAQLSAGNNDPQYTISIHRSQEDERGERELKPLDQQIPVIEEAPDDESAAAGGLRLPRPYRRWIPPYPETAARAEAEATVDVLVDLDASGDVTRVEVARWAGFGLDEVTVDTVRRLHFFPAMRNGVAVPLRVLLRYNFRKPAK
jgi:TonB family protein